MMFLVLACVVVGSFAEPPIDRRYLPPGQLQVEHVPPFKTPSTQYGAPAAPFESLKSSKLSHSSAKQVSGPVGKPVVPSSQYGPPPPQRLAVAPSNQYGPPVLPQRINAASNKQFSALTSFQKAGNIPSAEYGAPQRLSTLTKHNKSPVAFQNFANTPSNQYGAPIASHRLNTKPSTQYGPPVSTQRLVSGPSKQFSAPSISQKIAEAPFGTYKVNHHFNGASLKSPAKLYSAPITGQLKAPAVSGQYSAPRVADVKLSATTSSVPSTQYGAPYDAAIHSAHAQHGPQMAKLEILEEVSGVQEDGHSEPANYEFAYEVQAYEYGNEFGHRESRHGEDAKGEYHVVLPDGRRQVVEYKADLEGYRPVIRYEESGGTARRENLSVGGPY